MALPGSKIWETCTVFNGEFESEAGFAINLKKRIKHLEKHRKKNA